MDFAREPKKPTERSILQKKNDDSCYKGRKTWKEYWGKEKEMNLVLEKERLVKETEKVGGLWCSNEVAEKYFKKLKTEKEKKSALKIQLGFRPRCWELIMTNIFCHEKVLQRCQMSCCVIWYNHMMHSSWDMECDRQFLGILDHFLPF